MQVTLTELTAEVRRVSRLIATEFGRNHLVENKSDSTPVTAIDKAVNAELCAWATRNELGFVGEEGNSLETSASGYCVVGDPLDGTRAFVRGMGTVTTIVSILKVEGTKGTPLMAVIHNPVTGQTWKAQRGQGSYASIDNNSYIPARVNPTLSSNGKWRTAICAWPGVDSEFAEFKRAVVTSDDFDDQEMGAFGIGGGLIASGLIHATAISSTSAVETTAMSLIVREAGGVVVDLRGNPIDEFTLGIHKSKVDFLLPNGAILASSQEVADKLLKLYRPTN